jgi:hypothetical protein
MLFADCVSLRLKGTRKEKVYQLPIPHLMDELCRREARSAMIEKLKEPEMWKAPDLTFMLPKSSCPTP